MTDLYKKNHLFVFLALIIAICTINPSFCVEKINAGVVYEFYLDVNNQITDSTNIAPKNLPTISNEEVNIAYFKDFRPINMLSEKNLFTIQKPARKAINYEKIPKEYNLSLDPKNIQAAAKITPSYNELFARAVNLKNKEKYKDALEAINLALKENPLNTEGHFLKADILRLNGNYSESVFEYAVAINIDPMCTDAYFNIAKILENANKKELALEYYRYAYSTKPNDYEIRNIILAYEKQGIN